MLELAPGNPSMIYHRAMIEVALDDKSAARASIEAILGEDSAEFPEQADTRAFLDTL